MQSVALLARTHPWFTAVSATYALAVSALALQWFPSRSLIYLVLLMLDFLIVAILNRRVSLPSWVLWGLSAWGFMHIVGGLIPTDRSLDRVFYEVWLLPGLLRYDQLTHAFGFGMATAACWYAIDARVAPDAAPEGKAVMAVLMGLGLGALNEVVEFLSTFVLPQQHVGDFENMGFDLVFNLIGSASMGMVLRARATARATK